MQGTSLAHNPTGNVPVIDETPRKFGSLTVQVTAAVGGGWAINTQVGVDREPLLCFGSMEASVIFTICRTLAEGGQNGVHPEGILAAVRDALTRDLHTALRRRDADAGRLVEAINDALDRMRTPEQKAADDALVADIKATMKRTLANTVPAGTHRQVRPTMAGAHLADLTPAGQRAINSHRNGLVSPGNGISRPTLRSLARKGYGTLTFRGRTATITGLILNKRGMCAVKAEGGVR